MRHVSCIRRILTDNGVLEFSETWKVPEDFTDEEHRFLQELLEQNNLSPAESYNCIRALR